MRRFLITGHRANTDGNFILEDLPGSGGRMDILAISASSALFLSHGMRRDVEVWLVMMGGSPRTLKIIGSEARYLFPDERNMASMIRTALRRHGEGKKQTPGMYVEDSDLKKTVSEAAMDSRLFYLEEDGVDIRSIEIPEDATFILGDDQDLSREEESIVESYGAEKLSLGNKSMHTYQAICAVNYEIDRRENDGTDAL